MLAGKPMQGFDLDAHVTAMDEEGFTIVRNFLSPEVLAEVRRVVALYMGSHAGRNDFEGFQTERVYTLVARAKVFWDIVLDPRVLGLCERCLLPGFLLTASQAIQINPGETPQPFHADDQFYTFPRPRPMVSLSTIVAVDAFTAENGGTEIVPGSHRWTDAEVAGFVDPRRTSGGSEDAASSTRENSLAKAWARAVEMPPGACVVFAGTLVHRGGANRSRAPRCAFSNQYCQPWARQQENFTLSVPLEVARQMPSALKALLGYSIYPPFMGQLTASHPLKVLEDGYENRVVAQARLASARLPE
jgi:ectoine hydroxylase-related dioxygenase (phytanoyl-CoA dioxygenase family)